MNDPCFELERAITVNDYLGVLEKMIHSYGSTTNVSIEASHNNVQFLINDHCIESLSDYGGSLSHLHEIFEFLQKHYGNERVIVDSGPNNSYWVMQ